MSDRAVTPEPKRVFGPARHHLYRVRWARQGKDHRSRAYLGLPVAIAKVLPEGQLYDVYLTDEGILYRPVVSEPIVSTPAWVQKEIDKREQEG